MADLLPVADALARILDNVPVVEAETIAISDATQRTLAAPLIATRTQPPFDASAMDGYAVRALEAQPGVTLRVAGASVAGRSYGGALTAGEAVRIFTGAPVPPGADAVVIQEDVDANDGFVRIRAAARQGRHIRRTGVDFEAGQELLDAGRRLDARAIGLAAAMGYAALPVRRRPKVAILATGDELVRPGVPPGSDQIVLSNTYAIAALCEDAGATAIDLGIAADDLGSLETAIGRAREANADILVTTGGASVGDHDLVQSALAQQGVALDFWRIAMRPGKPFMFGSLGAMRIMGMPGNPVSSYVCGLIFLTPLIRALLGDPHAGEDRSEPARLGAPLPENDKRQEYMRATLARDASGALVATAVASQDSSITRLLAHADALIVRPAYAPAAPAGDACHIIKLPS